MFTIDDPCLWPRARLHGLLGSLRTATTQPDRWNPTACMILLARSVWGPGLRRATGWSLAACLLLAGCRAGERCCTDVPNGAIPQPPGTVGCQWQHAQMQLAEEDDFVIYHHEWLGRTARLSPAGERHVHGLAQRMVYAPAVVWIAPPFDSTAFAEDEALSAERRQVVIEKLAAAGVEGAEELVQVGYPQAEPLYGEEAVRYGVNRLSGRAGAGGSLTGGFGGAGLGGGGFSTSNTMGGGFMGGGFF